MSIQHHPPGLPSLHMADGKLRVVLQDSANTHQHRIVGGTPLVHYPAGAFVGNPAGIAVPGRNAAVQGLGNLQVNKRLSGLDKFEVVFI